MSCKVNQIRVPFQQTFCYLCEVSLACNFSRSKLFLQKSFCCNMQKGFSNPIMLNYSFGISAISRVFDFIILSVDNNPCNFCNLERKYDIIIKISIITCQQSFADTKKANRLDVKLHSPAACTEEITCMWKQGWRVCYGKGACRCMFCSKMMWPMV